MRVITGAYKGRRLIVPRGHDVRPTSDYMRQALFNILGDSIMGARVLDLFAGTGSVGIEALSRGAEHVTFVEKSHKVAATLRRNIDSLKAEPSRYSLREGDATTLRRGASLWHLVFADPPYDMADFPLAQLAGNVGAPESLLVVEHRAKTPPSEVGAAVNCVDRRVYGQSAFSFYEFASPE